MLPVLWVCDPRRHRHTGGEDQLQLTGGWKEFARRREGICYALDGGVWLHRWRLRDEPLVHLVSADKARLLALGRDLGFHPAWLQYKPLKDPRTGHRVPAWHWDVWGSHLRKLEGSPPIPRTSGP